MSPGSWTLTAAAALMLGVAVFWLVRALVTGRAPGRFGTADRATQPGRFWTHVAVLVGIAAVAGTEVLFVTIGAERGFHARHALPAVAELSPSPVARLTPSGCDDAGPRVCLVAAGTAPDIAIDVLARYYSRLLGSTVGVLDPVALVREADGMPLVNAQRAQVGVGALLRLVRDTYPTLWADRGVTLVIATSDDLWVESRPGWQYALGGATARSGGGGFAVVSSARLDPAVYGRTSDPAVLEQRVHAMIGKYVAILRYGEAVSSDPSSPVYGAIQSPTDLDRMQPFSPPR